MLYGKSVVSVYGLSFLTVAVAFAFAAYLYLWVKKQKTGNARIQRFPR